MPRKPNWVIQLDPNSMYHQILVKNLGTEGAKKALLNAKLEYIFGLKTYYKVMQYKPKLSTVAK